MVSWFLFALIPITMLWVFVFFAAAFARQTVTFFGARYTLFQWLARAHQELWLFASAGLILAAYRAWLAPQWWRLPVVVIEILLWWSVRDWPDTTVWLPRLRKVQRRLRRLMASDHAH